MAPVPSQPDMDVLERPAPSVEERNAWSLFVLLVYDMNFASEAEDVLALLAPIEKVEDAWRLGDMPPTEVFGSRDDDKLQEMGLQAGDVFRAAVTLLGEDFATTLLESVGGDVPYRLTTFSPPYDYGTGRLVKLDCVLPILRGPRPGGR